jgi:hypothetical protein
VLAVENGEHSLYDIIEEIRDVQLTEMDGGERWRSRFFWVSDPLCLSSSSSALHFSGYSFWVHHLVNQDYRQLLAHAMASDFSVAWQCVSKRTIGFYLRIKLHARRSRFFVAIFKRVFVPKGLFTRNVKFCVRRHKIRVV